MAGWSKVGSNGRIAFFGTLKVAFEFTLDGKPLITDPIICYWLSTYLLTF
jgi:hypothetical protein